MTKKETILFIAFLSAMIICALVLIIQTNDTKHKYAISFQNGKYTGWDYTDTFNVTNGSINYVDEQGREITRYGTFAIQKNEYYNK